MAVYIILFSARIVAMNYRMTKKFHGRGVFLPIHIMSIATSYMILIISTHAWVIDRIGEGSFFWFGLPLIVAADVIGVFALGVIWRFQCEKKEAMEDESVPR